MEKHLALSQLPHKAGAFQLCHLCRKLQLTECRNVFPQLRNISKLFSVFICSDLTKIPPPLMATKLNYCNSDSV